MFCDETSHLCDKTWWEQSRNFFHLPNVIFLRKSLLNRNLWINIQINFVRIKGKISAQPQTTLCIQILDRENNDKNNTLPLGKQICFIIVWGCAEILPNQGFFTMMLNFLFFVPYSDVNHNEDNKLNKHNKQNSQARINGLSSTGGTSLR